MKTAVDKSKSQVLFEKLLLWSDLSCLFTGWLRIEAVLASWARGSFIFRFLLQDRNDWIEGSWVYQGFWALISWFWQLGCGAASVALRILRKVFPQAVIYDSWVGLVITGLFTNPGSILVITVFLMPLIPTKATLGMLLLFIISVVVSVTTSVSASVSNSVSNSVTTLDKLNMVDQKSKGSGWFKRVDAFRQSWGTPFDLPVILFLSILAVAAVLSIERTQSMITGLLYLLFVLFFYLVSWVLSRENHASSLKAVVWALMLASVILSLFGLYQYVVGVPVEKSWVDEKMFTGLESRVFATLDNPNVLAEFFVFTIPLSLAVLWSSRNNITRLFIAGIIGLSVLCLVLTFSRGAWLGFALAMLIFFLLKDRRALFLLLIMGVVGMFFLPESILARVASIGNLQESSTAYRLSIWAASLRIIADYWVSGIGPGLPTFAIVYPYYSLAAGMAYHSHNLFLQLVVEMGIVGLGAFLWLMWTFVRVGLKGLRATEDPYLKNLLIGLLSGMAGFLLQGLTDYVWYSPRLILTFWLMLGLMAAAVRQGDSPSPNLPEVCRKAG